MSPAAKKCSKNKGESYHHGDLRAALVLEACKILERDGPEKLSLRGVAQAVGVSQTAPYHHFKDKQALLAAVAAAGFREFTATMTDRAEAAATPAEKLQLLGLGYVEFAVGRPLLFRLMQGPAFGADKTSEALNAARNESYAPLIDAVSACLPDASEAKIRNACAAAWSMVHGMATLCNDGRLETVIDVNNLASATLAVTAQLAVQNAPDRA